MRSPQPPPCAARAAQVIQKHSITPQSGALAGHLLQISQRASFQIDAGCPAHEADSLRGRSQVVLRLNPVEVIKEPPARGVHTLPGTLRFEQQVDFQLDLVRQMATSRFIDQLIPRLPVRA